MFCGPQNYKHNHAMHIEACANTLLKIFNK